ncbi:MAG: metal-dependent transcriptional regulator [Planctomycetota bacterium]|jgi:DtxR family Mn-dependent transcriptional regulator
MPNTLPDLTASQEDYLEAIYHLILQDQVARSSEISRALNVHKSSVTGALKALTKLELIHYEPYGHITLTEIGRRKAEDIVRRHETLKGFFHQVLGIEGEEAEEAACRMEHATSRGVVNRLILLGEFLERSGKEGVAWKNEFQDFCHEVESQQEAHRQDQAPSPPKGRRRKGKATTLRDLEAGDRAILAALTGPRPAPSRFRFADTTSRSRQLRRRKSALPSHREHPLERKR